MLGPTLWLKKVNYANAKLKNINLAQCARHETRLFKDYVVINSFECKLSTLRLSETHKIDRYNMLNFRRGQGKSEFDLTEDVLMSAVIDCEYDDDYSAEVNVVKKMEEEEVGEIEDILTDLEDNFGESETVNTEKTEIKKTEIETTEAETIEPSTTRLETTSVSDVTNFTTSLHQLLDRIHENVDPQGPIVLSPVVLISYEEIERNISSSNSDSIQNLPEVRKASEFNPGVGAIVILSICLSVLLVTATVTMCLFQERLKEFG